MKYCSNTLKWIGKLPAAMIVVIVCCIHSPAMTSQYIESKFSASIDYSKRDNTAQNKPSYFLTDFFRLPRQGFSAQKLQNDPANFGDLSKTGSDLKAYLLSTVRLFRLGEMGAQDAYGKAGRILDKAAEDYPQNSEVVWLKGLQLIKAGDVFKGMLLLDSLRLSGFAENEFLVDYASQVFHAFIPEKKTTGRFVLKNGIQAAERDTASPTWLEWEITAFNSNKTSLPAFSCKATFAYRKPSPLIFNGLLSTQTSSAMLQFPKTYYQKSIPYAIKDQPFEKKETAHLSVYIDLNDTQCPSYEYLKKRVDGKYDSIVVQKDLSQYDALSLRCYRNNYSPGREGSCTAYITFDRRFCDILYANSHKKPVLNHDSLRKIRFTVTIESTDDIQTLAEAKLQSIIRAF